MNIWLMVGIGLILWTLWDLCIGKSWFIDRIYKRVNEPVMYWVSWSTWFIIAVIVTLGGI